MHVVEELTFGRDLAQFRNAPRAVRDRALEMGYPADHIDAHIERPGEIGRRCRRAEIAVLRKGNDLEIDIGGDFPPHLY